MQTELGQPIPVQPEKIDFSYDCFVSYRRSDGTRIARWLRRHLLSYRLPRGFQEDHGRALSIYLDTAYERATDDYYDNNIAPALKESRFLLVVATPSANDTLEDGKPNWVEREIADYLRTPQRNNILAVRAAGQWNDPFPGTLQSLFPYLHIVDLRDVSNSPLRRLLDWIITPPEVTTLAAPLFGIPQRQMPELRQEETKRARLRLISAVALAATVFISVASLGAYGWYQKIKVDAASQTILARYLAWQSGIVAAESPRRLEEGLLLAIEAYRRDASSVTSNSLYNRVDQAPFPIARLRHDARVNAIKFTPDGNALVSADDDGNVRVWNTETQELVTQLSQDKPALQFKFGPGQSEITAIFGPLPTRIGDANDTIDTSRLVSWRWKENTITARYEAPKPLYDVAFNSGQVIGILNGGIWRPQDVQAAMFPGYGTEDRIRAALAPDSQFVAIARMGGAKNVDVFDLATGHRVQSIEFEDDIEVTAIYFNQDGSRLLIGKGDGETLVFKWRLNERLFAHKGYSDPSAFAFSHDGKYVAEIDNSQGSLLKIWQSEDGRDVFTLDQAEEESGPVFVRAVFSDDSRLLAVCLNDRAVRVIRVDGDHSTQIFKFTPEAIVRSIAFHPDGSLLATADSDGWVTLWRLNRGRAAAEFNAATGFELSQADDRVALFGNRLRVVDSQLKDIEFDLDTSRVRVARFSGSGKMLALGRDNGSVALVDFDAKKITSWFDPGAPKRQATAVDDDEHEDGSARAVVNMSFSSEEKKLVVVRTSGISEINLTESTERVRLSDDLSGYSAISSDGSLLATKKLSGPIQIYSLERFEKIWTIPSGAVDPVIAFSPDGQLFAGRVMKTVRPEDPQSRSEEVVVWSVATRQPILLAPVTSETSQLSFDSNSEYLAFTDGEKIQLWNLRTKERKDLAQRMNEVGSISFHPRDSYLAAGYHDRKIRVWKLFSDPLVLTEIPQDRDFDFGSPPVRFSRDGRLLLRADGYSGREVVSFLPWQPQDTLRGACSRSIRKGLAKAVWDEYLKGQPYRETCALP
jgi:WD40 repeat protein